MPGQTRSSESSASSSGSSGHSPGSSGPGTSMGSQSSAEDLDTTAHELAAYVIQDRVFSAGETWWNCPELPDRPAPFFDVMRDLCREFRARAALRPPAYEEWLERIEFDSSSAYPLFVSVASQLVGEGAVSWGRIVGLYAFTADLGLRCIQRKQEPLVVDLSNYLGMYTEHYLDAWVHKHGGWNGLVEWSQLPINTQVKGESSWSRYGLLVGASAVAVGSLILYRSNSSL